MLTVAEERIQEIAKETDKKISIHLYGQENSDETYAIARSDMLLKARVTQANNIFFGSTISNDGLPESPLTLCSPILPLNSLENGSESMG